MLWNRAVERVVFKGDGRMSLGDCWLSQRCLQVEFEGGDDRRACEGFDELWVKNVTGRKADHKDARYHHKVHGEKELRRSSCGRSWNQASASATRQMGAQCSMGASEAECPHQKKNKGGYGFDHRIEKCTRRWLHWSTAVGCSKSEAVSIYRKGIQSRRLSSSSTREQQGY